MKSRTQQGSIVHIIVIIVLVLALVSALGYIFWLNVSKQATDSVKTSDSTASESENQNETDSKNLATISQSLDGYTLSYNYPEEWIVSGDTISDPDSDIIITINLFNPEGLGGACGDGDSISDPITSLEWEQSPSFSKALFVQSTSTFENHYTYRMSLESSSQEAIKTAQVGDSNCNTFGVANGMIRVSDDESTKPVLLYNRVQFRTLAEPTDINTMRTDLTLDEILEAFESEVGKQARAILESVSVK